MWEMLETSRLILRRFVDDDLDVLTAIRSDPLVARFIGSGRPQSREQVADMMRAVESTWEHRGFGRYAVTLRPGGGMIGWCGLSLLDYTEEIELGYGIAQEEWGNGYATEAAAAVLKHAFASLHVDRIVAVADPTNAPSVRVLEKIGMVRERETEFYGRSVVYYAIERTSRTSSGPEDSGPSSCDHPPPL